MKLLLAAVLASGVALAVPTAFAQQTSPQAPVTAPQPGDSGKTTTTKPAKPKKPKTAQQKKMSDCSHEAKAKGFKGDQRKQFMSNCLKSE